MTTKKTVFIAGTIALMSARAVLATDLTWDANGTGTGQTDGAGTWLNANMWWNGSANATWNNETPDNANIGNGGAGGTITVGNVTNGTVAINNFTGTYTIQGTSNILSQSGGITIGATAGIVAFRGTGSSALLILAGTGGLTMNCPGVVVMRENLVHSYTGVTVVNAGVILLAGSHSVGNFTLNNGMLTDYYRATTTFTSGLGAGNNQIQMYGACGFGGGNGNSTWRIGTAGSSLIWGSTYFNPTTLKFLTPNDNMGPTTYGQVTFDNGLNLNGGARTIQVLAATGVNAIYSSWVKINGAITGSGGSLIKTGGGNLVLLGVNTYDGGTSVNQGMLQFNASTAIGGTGRNVSVTNGAMVAAGYAINNAFLNRLVESTNAFIVALVADSSNALDLNTSTGANLPNVSLGAVNARTYSGTLTPNNNTYRLGGGSTLTVSSAIAGVARSLVVNGNVTLTGTIDYGENTTVTSGTLQMNARNTCAEAGKIVTIAAAGATLNLNFTGTNTVEQLFIGTTEKAEGLYGAGGTSLPQITGTGTLNVVGLPPSGTMTVID